MPGTLFIAATPIGNLEDLSLRLIRVLRETTIIACEDTRQTSKLLKHLDIDGKRFISIHEHTDDRKTASVIEKIKRGENVVYMSDAGTPGVNDPGGKLVARAIDVGLTVVPVPGPSALTTAISVCGFPMDEFVYIGFLPHKKGRETALREIGERKQATIFFESTHRIEKTITSLKAQIDPKRLVFVGRELTKLHETLYRGQMTEIEAKLEATSLRGEFVMIVAPWKFHS